METNEEYIKGLKEKRARAITERDGIMYIQTTEALGFDLDEIPGLADKGYDQMALEQNPSKNTGGLEASLESDKKAKWVGIINSTNYFSIRQGPTRLKLKRVLGKLKKAGCDTKYDPKMNTSEMWGCYFKDKKNILSL